MSSDDNWTLTKFKSCSCVRQKTIRSHLGYVRIYFSDSLLIISDFLRAQPPEIVPKTATTNIFGVRNQEVEDENQVDLVPPGKHFSRLNSNQILMNDYLIESNDKNTTRKFVTYDELRQRNRAEHASKFAGPKPRNGLSLFVFYSSCSCDFFQMYLHPFKIPNNFHLCQSYPTTQHLVRSLPINQKEQLFEKINMVMKSMINFCKLSPPFLSQMK